jgi:prefoldin subunit 5
MKKIFAILAITGCFLGLSACADQEMNNEIARLKANKVEMERQIQAMQQELDSLKRQNAKLASELSALDMN